MSKAVLTLVDAGSQKSRVSVEGATVADMETFLGTYSLAGLTGGVTVTPETITPTSPDSSANVDKKANCTFKNGAGQLFRLCIPAPDPVSVITELTEAGERVTQSAGNAIAIDYGLVISESLTFLRGSITQRV